MKKVIAICNLHDDPSLGVLTKERPLGAVTFLGRYGVMDFALSNFSNSEIDKIFVLVKNGILAIRSHIKGGVIYLNNTRLGFVSLLFNEKALGKPKINTDLANVKANLNVEKFDFDYVVIAPSYVLTSMNYRPMVEEHAASNADISIVYSHINNSKNYKALNSLKINGDLITSIESNNLKEKEVNLCLESYIVSRKVFEKILKASEKESSSITAKEIVAKLINKKVLKAHAIKFDGYFVPVTSLENYINYSFELLNYHTRCQLFLQDWPIYSTNHNAPPAKYEKDADVQNCFVSNGCIIKGKVTNCVLSRDVVVEEGASLSNCIMFTGDKVGKNAQLKYVLADKKCSIADNKKLIGKENNFCQVGYGEIVK